jgi:hypothetical protein
MPELRISVSSINNEISKLYDAKFINLFLSFSVKWKVGWAHLLLVFVAPAKSNNK